MASSVCVLKNRLYITSSPSELQGLKGFRILSTDDRIVYHPFYDDFGPMNIFCLLRFSETLQLEMLQNNDQKLIHSIKPGARALTNAILLVGGFLILALNYEAQRVSKVFKSAYERALDYCDAGFESTGFGVSLLDCWIALEKSKKLGWFQTTEVSGILGCIDPDEYEHYENPINGDLTKIVPNKLIVFKGPEDIKCAAYRDDGGFRLFSPNYYIDIFKTQRVTTVVRLNKAQYDATAFEVHGISVIELQFGDKCVPPAEMVGAFLGVVDAARCVVAVHCESGRAKTGVLMGVYLVRTHGFTAREAIAWTRIMRPGSVIGAQQDFLCRVEALLRPASPARRHLLHDATPPAICPTSPAEEREGPDQFRLLQANTLAGRVECSGGLWGAKPGRRNLRCRSVAGQAEAAGTGAAAGTRVPQTPASTNGGGGVTTAGPRILSEGTPAASERTASLGTTIRRGEAARDCSQRGGGGGGDRAKSATVARRGSWA